MSKVTRTIKETSEEQLDIVRILRLDSLVVNSEEKIQFLILEAQKRLTKSILGMFLKELQNSEKLKNSSPTEILSCVNKLMRLAKDYASDRELIKVRDKILGILEEEDASVDLAEMRIRR